MRSRDHGAWKNLVESGKELEELSVTRPRGETTRARGMLKFKFPNSICAGGECKSNTFGKK